jgi:DNA ligase-1
MHRFTQLFNELDGNASQCDKLSALEHYFREVPTADAAWALSLLYGQKLQRVVTTRQLRAWATEATGLPDWLFDEAHAHVGDLAETIAALLPAVDGKCEISLAQFVEQHVKALHGLPEDEQRARVLANWQLLDRDERYLWHKMLTGSFRSPVPQTLVAQALAQVAGVNPAVMAHRLAKTWPHTAEIFTELLSSADASGDVGQPHPFFFSHELQGNVSSLGDVADWQIEWMWDGVRAQIIQRSGQLLVWSRGEELLTDRFPELHPLATLLPEGTVLDGQLLAWRGDEPLSIALLHKRIGRRRVDAKLLVEAPITFMAYDVLETGGVDLRSLPLTERRLQLEEICRVLSLAEAPTMAHLSPLIVAEKWSRAIELRQQARQRGAKGLMLKRRDSPYGTGRPQGAWWKWKVAPLSINAVLMYAQAGSSGRAGPFAEYTFGVWNGDLLVPVAKSHLELSDDELTEVNAFIREHTIEKFGPVRVVDPQLVFEFHFEGIQPSSRHKSGVTLRLPRVCRWHKDKPPIEADRLETLKGMCKK